MAAAKKRRYAPEERMARLTQTAAEVIADQRCLPISYDHLAQRADVTTPLLYRYFSNADEIHIRALAYQLDGLDSAMEEVKPDVESLVRAYMNYVLAQGAAHSVILTDVSFLAGLPKNVRVRLQAPLLKYGRLIRMWTGADRRQCLLAVLMFLAVMDDLANQCRDGALPRDEAIAYAVDLAALGLRTMKKQAQNPPASFRA